MVYELVNLFFESEILVLKVFDLRSTEVKKSDIVLVGVYLWDIIDGRSSYLVFILKIRNLILF